MLFVFLCLIRLGRNGLSALVHRRRCGVDTGEVLDPGGVARSGEPASGWLCESSLSFGGSSQHDDFEPACRT